MAKAHSWLPDGSVRCRTCSLDGSTTSGRESTLGDEESLSAGERPADAQSGARVDGFGDLGFLQAVETFVWWGEGDETSLPHAMGQKLALIFCPTRVGSLNNQ
jgi:hypothetical protein